MQVSCRISNQELLEQLIIRRAAHHPSGCSALAIDSVKSWLTHNISLSTLAKLC